MFSRFKLLFSLLLLWLIPVAGYFLYHFLDAKIIHSAYQESLMSSQAYSKIVSLESASNPAFRNLLIEQKSSKQLQVPKRTRPILIDGYADDWFDYVEVTSKTAATNKDRMKIIEDDHYLYGIFEIYDDDIRYKMDHYSVVNADGVKLDLGFGEWLFQAIAPGVVQPNINGATQLDNAIYAVWQEHQNGYNLEFRVAKKYVGLNLSAIRFDVSEKSIAQKLRPNITSFTDFDSFELVREFSQLGLLSLQESNTDERYEYQVGIYNEVGQLRYSEGGFKYQEQNFLGFFQERLNDYSLTKSQIEALVERNDKLLIQSKKSNLIQSAAKITEVAGSPLYLVTRSSVLKSRFELKLIFYTAFFVFCLLWLIALLSLFSLRRKAANRVIAIQNSLEKAYELDSDHLELDSDELKQSDVLGDLGTSLYYFNEQQLERRDHQQQLYARLNHELRTPIAIVRSSLDNMELNSDDNKMLHINAINGIERLSGTLSRLGEANRLEASIKSAKLSSLELNSLLAELVDSYRLNWDKHSFKLKLPEERFNIRANKELVAQMLDKIISNAVDFCEINKPIVICLKKVDGDLELSIQNSGPTIPQERLKTLFSMMNSSREGGSSGHLGLGLYMARLIIMKLKGRVFVKNLDTNNGVVFIFSWKRNNYTEIR